MFDQFKNLIKIIPKINRIEKNVSELAKPKKFPWVKAFLLILLDFVINILASVVFDYYGLVISLFVAIAFAFIIIVVSLFLWAKD